MTRRPRRASALAPASSVARGGDVIDHDVDALPAGQIQQLLDDAAGAGIDHLVGAGLSAGVEFFRLGVDRDHARPRPFRHHQLMDAEPAAGAEHRNGLAGLHAGAAEHLIGCRQRVGDHADLGGMLFVVEAVRQLDEVRRRQLDVFGIGAVAFEPDLAAAVLAQRLQIRQAPAAMAAVEIEIGGHRIADFKSAHARADLDDLAGDLVADDAGELHLPPPGLGVLDGQAGAAGDDTGHRLAGTGRPDRAAAPIGTAGSDPSTPSPSWDFLTSVPARVNARL